MHSDTLIMVKGFYRRTGIQQLDLPADKPIRDAVIMFIRSKAYIAVLHHGSMELLFKLVTQNRQRVEHLPLYFIELLPSAIVPALQEPVVVLFEHTLMASFRSFNEW